MKRCLIIGGGIAGLNAASILSAHNISVTLVESSPKLGGRTYSFLDAKINDVIDNGQHILMGCYKESLSFIKLIGVNDNFDYQKNLKIVFLSKNKNAFELNAAKFFYPFNLLNAVFNYRVLGFADKIKFITFLIKLPLISKKSLVKLSVIDWLKKENQNDVIIKNFWEILCVGAFNTNLSKASALIFYEVLMQIFFKGNIASTIILPKYGLSESIIEPAAAFINSYNGKIVTSETIKEVVVKNQKVISVNSENKSYTNFDFVISAIPFYALQKIISRESLVTDIELQYSTIINIHFWFNDFKMTEKFYGLLNSPLHWIFNKNNYINVVISDADYLSGKSKEEIFNFVVNELVKYFTIKKESITYYKIIKEKRATFIPEKSIICKRPKSKTNIKNLFLAGDWIDTGLPSTIESAAKSGRIAAELVLNETK